MITGLSPSVVRAAAMFSFFVIGKAINRHADVLNIVFVSLALLLIIDPSLLFSVGFQLSYSAVIAIVIIYPWIYKSLIIKNWILDKIWSISCVSICAQIGTLPLVIFYFHQFPNYFLFSNLLVIPLVPLVIVSGLLALLFFYVPYLNIWTGYLFQLLVDLLIQIVNFFDNLPYNVSSGIYPDLWDVFIIYAIVVFLGYWLLAKRKWCFVVSLGLCLCLSGKSFLNRQLESSQTTFVVYDSKDQPIYDLIIGNHCFENGSIRNLSSFNRGAIENSRSVMGVTSNQPLSSIKHKPYHLNSNTLVVSQGLIQINDNRIVLAKERYHVVYEAPIAANLLVVSNDYRGAINDLDILFSPKSIVFDSTVRGKLLKNWLIDCSEMGIDSYSVHNSGAFVAHL
jgi:competence protein ComEC